MAKTPPEPAEPHWLDPDELRAWRALAGVVLLLDGALDAQLRRDAGLTHFEYGVLAALSEAPGKAMRMSVLAAFARGSLPRLSQVVSRLESSGLIRRVPDPEDGRYTIAVMTDAGFEAIVAAAPGHVAEVRRLVLDPLTKTQVKQLRTIGDRILRAIDPDGRFA